ncbi:TolC family protein [Robbsia sp. KACC 23696]|uniref:TolC family protein n=1 Tax=Robbsia sp. KACC 23696 TaxID=3149231 RepID=UPI00325B585A
MRAAYRRLMTRSPLRSSRRPLMHSLMRPIVWALTCAASLGVGACGYFHPVGPDYHAPTAPADARDAVTAPQGQRTAFTPQAMPDDWWHLYDAPALNAIVEEALTANRTLRSAAAHLDAAQGALDQARAAWLPTTSLGAQYARERGNVYGASGLYRHNVAEWNFNVAYDVDLAGRLHRAVEAADATVQAQQYAYAASQLTVVAKTVSAYALVCQANASLANAKQQLRIAQDQARVTTQLAARGAASTLDQLRAEAQVDTQQAALPPIEAQRQTGLYALAVLLGRDPTRFPAAAADCQTLPVLAQPMPVGDGMPLLRRRPDVAEAERTLAASTADIGVAVAQLYPSVSLGIGVGGEGTTIGSTLQSSGRTWSIGPMMHWTFPNIATARAQIRAQRANTAGALSAYDATVLNALKEADSALENYARALDRQQAITQLDTHSQLALAQAQRLYRFGATPFLDLLEAQRTAASSAQQRIAAAGEVLSDQVAVFQALGGGWGDAAKRAAAQSQAADARLAETLHPTQPKTTE